MGRTAGYQGLRGLIGVVAAAATLIPAMPGAVQARDEGWDPDFQITVPSGQSVTFMDIIRGEDSAVGTAIRYRFLAPGIARSDGSVAFMQAEEDMVVICQDYVLPQIHVAPGEMPDQIIIVLADRPTVHGIADPEATQFFEAYRPEDGLCIWEGF